MSQKNLSIKGVVEKIEKMAKARMSEQDVVSLDKFRGLKDKNSPKHILLIDDDPTVRKSLVRALEKDNYKVLAIEDGTRLSEVLDPSIPIDFIILDIGLPWLDGYELASVLKESEELEDIPMIFLSGRKEEDDVKRGFEAGADDYIKKPFDLKQLKKTIETLISLRES